MIELAYLEKLSDLVDVIGAKRSRVPLDLNRGTPMKCCNRPSTFVPLFVPVAIRLKTSGWIWPQQR